MNSPCILLASGRYFNFENPDPDSFTIHDIAAALSNICRFTGHCNFFYSVAQHSVYASHIVEPEFALPTLMHDSVEAFMGDISSPLKRILPDFKLLEKKIEAVVWGKFGFGPELPPEVKVADLKMLQAERKQIMPKHNDAEWAIVNGVPDIDLKIKYWPQSWAYEMFLRRYEELTK